MPVLKAFGILFIKMTLHLSSCNDNFFTDGTTNIRWTEKARYSQKVSLDVCCKIFKQGVKQNLVRWISFDFVQQQRSFLQSFFIHKQYRINRAQLLDWCQVVSLQSLFFTSWRWFAAKHIPFHCITNRFPLQFKKYSSWDASIINNMEMENAVQVDNWNQF